MLLKRFKILFGFILILLSFPALSQEEWAMPKSRGELQTEPQMPTWAISQTDTISRAKDTVLIRREIILMRRDSVKRYPILLLRPGGAQFTMKDSLVSIYDTLLMSQDTVFSLNQKIFRSIESFSHKKNPLSRLVKNFFHYDPPSLVPEKKGSLERSDKPYMEFEDMIIRRVTVVVYDAVGYDVRNPDKKPRSIFEKVGNFVHIKSRANLIRNKLLFKEGQRIDPFKLSESERLLRQNSYIYDARIKVSRIAGTDSADVIVYSQDVFSTSVGGGGDLANKRVDFSIQEVNFLGLGQAVSYRTRIWNQLPGGANHYLNYNVPNIYNSLIASNVFYNLNNGKESFGAGLNRGLISPALQWVGGLNIRWLKFPYKNNIRILPVYESDTVSLNQQDLWAGIATSALSRKKPDADNGKFFIAGRYLRTYYTQCPLIPHYSTFPYYNSDFFLGSFSFYSRSNYKDRLIFRFGRTEDIPEGKLFSLIGGMQFSGRANRPYLGVVSSFSKYQNHFGYYFFNIQAGSFFNRGEVEEGVIQFKNLYFSPQIQFDGWKWRQFLAFRFTQGFNLISGNTLNINNKNGVRGFSSPFLKGNKKVIFNYESDIFLPFNLVGFRIAFIFFTDIAWISFQGQLLSKNHFFPGYGIGFKIHNDHLTFNTIQILLGYYPNASRIGTRDFGFFQRSYSFFTFNEFSYGKPGVIPFY